MEALVRALEHAGLTVVFLAVLCEQAGLPIPTYPLLIVAGAASVARGSTATAVVLAAVAAALVADLAWYAAGRRFGSGVLRQMCRLSLSPDSCIADTERVFARLGSRVLLFAKFVPGLGAVATAMSGVVGASLAGFVVYDTLGAAIWAGSAVVLGVLFHDAVDEMFVELEGLGRGGVVVLAVVLGAFLAQRWWRRRLFFRELRMARISALELNELIQRGESPTIIDARAASSRDRDGMIPGAIAFESLDPGRVREALGPAVEVVVYCACPNEASAARIAKALLRLGYERVRPLEGGIHAWRAAGFAVAGP
jgi:membrane protein DedA with SNARE-associated domain/rhodanese-related sulfurtransferase